MNHPKIILATLAAALLCGCTKTSMIPGTTPRYQEAYQATDPKKIGALTPGSREEREAIRRFEDFLGVLDEDHVKNKLRMAYASDVYFNDTLKEIIGTDELEKYLMNTVKNVDACTVDFLDVAQSGGEYYFRWLMKIKFKKFKKGEEQDSIGITHIRFNKEGKVIFHQDYWDAASNFFEKVPFVGWPIRKIKKGL